MGSPGFGVEASDASGAFRIRLGFGAPVVKSVLIIRAEGLGLRVFRGLGV